VDVSLDFPAHLVQVQSDARLNLVQNLVNSQLVHSVNLLSRLLEHGSVSEEVLHGEHSDNLLLLWFAEAFESLIVRECGSHDLIDGRLELHRLSEGTLYLLLLLLYFSLLS
jgi:hypothetical protein